ncbi:MAG: hypothetical protein F4X12_10290 [Acidobacteriia bacterium]|nr:hypothetical protein [Terriglobia bacterium]
MEGFFNRYAEFLYQISMRSQLGSNPVGIDRGSGAGRIFPKARAIKPAVTGHGYEAPRSSS